MADDPKPLPGKPLTLVFAAMALLALVAWLVAGFYGCKHAGLV